MQIEVGKYYRSRSSGTFGPIQANDNVQYPFRDSECRSWTSEGRRIHGEDSSTDLVELAHTVFTEPLPLEYDAALNDAAAELYRARVTLGFGPFHSAHEGYAILLEEADELKAHVWANQKRRDLEAMRKEAIQVAAMALAFAAEVCSEERGRV